MLISYYTILLSYLFSKTYLVLACFPLTLKKLILYTYIGITICPYATFRRFDAPNQIRQH